LCYANVLNIEHCVLWFWIVVDEWIEIILGQRVVIVQNNFKFLATRFGGVDIVIWIHEITRMWWLKDGPSTHE
jgi:hypothetical protein